MFRNRSLRVLVLAGLGAATSVLLAWALRGYYQYAATPMPRPPYLIKEQGMVREALVLRQPGRYSVVYQMIYPEGRGGDMSIITQAGTPEPRATTVMDPADEPGWVRNLRVGQNRVAAIGGYGLPWKCVKSFSVHSPGGVQQFGLVVTPAWLGPAGDIRLPVSPIWPGLVGNSVAWGAAWWGALAGAAALRRAHRRRRVRCPECGYSLMGLSPGAPCPECGKSERVSA